MISRARLALLFAILAVSGCRAQTRHTFGISSKEFVLDGKPFQIISGEMHYSRIPREYWHDRLNKARAMGLNTISTYVFWNLHEPQPGVYAFSGQNDVAAFIRAAQEEGLYVILRPGPYVCAEWDLGGLPAWLLADPAMVLRSTDEGFLRPAERWLKRLGQELAPLQITRGGPIIAVQVENEYGSFDSDKEYLGRIRKALVDAGLGEAMQYTADGPQQLPKGSLADLPSVVNFGPGEAKSAFQKLAAFRPNQPLMAGEYWAGWFDQWGHKHEATVAAVQEKEVDWILSQGYSINFYMFHGGTSFGFMNGANHDGEYRPQTTSYDYDAALGESGRPTPKYYVFREIIARHRRGVSIPAPPETPPAITLAPMQLSHVGSLWDNLGSPVSSPTPKTMEQLGQSYGYILYRHQLNGPVDGRLKLRDLQDFAEIFIDGRRVGSLDRRLGQDSLAIHVASAHARLDILVENSGRINFTKRLRAERKGITAAELNAKPLEGWFVYSLPLTDVAHLRPTKKKPGAPAFYQATFRLSNAGDTFLDTRSLGKGVAWVNRHPLGRFWKIGPQQTLYVPGPWLRAGENKILIFDLEGGSGRTVQGLNEPILDDLREDRSAVKH